MFYIVLAVVGYAGYQYGRRVERATVKPPAPVDPRVELLAAELRRQDAIAAQASAERTKAALVQSLAASNPPPAGN